MSLNRNSNRVTTKETVVISDSVPKNYRNWSELPGDLTLMILMKLSAVEILESAQFVCKLWYILCKEPSIWRTIHIKYSRVLEISYMDEKKMMLKYEKMTLNAIDRSDGSLIDLSIENFGCNDICSYFPSRSTQLKRLRLACCENISGKVFIEALESLSSLEELDLTLCHFQEEAPCSILRWPLQERVAVSIISSCPSLTTFKFNQPGSKYPNMACDVALAIANNMSELRHLQLIGNSLMDVGLIAILDRCTHLESLDLRACFHIELEENLEERLLEEIKDFRRPYDSTDDYDYHIKYHYSSDSSVEEYADAYDSDFLKELICLMSDV